MSTHHSDGIGLLYCSLTSEAREYFLTIPLLIVIETMGMTIRARSLCDRREKEKIKKYKKRKSKKSNPPPKPPNGDCKDEKNVRSSHICGSFVSGFNGIRPGTKSVLVSRRAKWESANPTLTNVSYNKCRSRKCQWQHPPRGRPSRSL